MRIYVIICALLISGCQNEFPETPQGEVVQTGSADLRRSVIIGGTFLSGYMDDALYLSGQSQSFISLFFSQIPEIDYNQATYESNSGFNGGFSKTSSGKALLGFTDEVDFTIRERLEADFGPLNDRFMPDEIDDLSFPNLRLLDISKSISEVDNPFLERVSSPNGESLLSLLIQKNPSFIFFQPGWDDLLHYSANGVSGSVSENATRFEDALSGKSFKESLNTIVNRLLSDTEAELILINIPDFTEFPFFSLIPWYMESIPSFGYSSFNSDVIQYNIENNFQEPTRPTIIVAGNGSNLFRKWVLVDEALPVAFLGEREIPKWRQIFLRDFPFVGERILLPVRENAELRTGIIQVPDSLAITFQEEGAIRSLISFYNDEILRISQSSDRIRLFDLENIFNGILKEETTIDGVRFTTDLSVASIFSADAIYLNPRGQALLANELIGFFNSEYGAAVPLLDPNSFRGNNYKDVADE